MRRRGVPWCATFALVALIVGPTSTLGAPAITAKLAVNDPAHGHVMHGALQLDLGGGALQGLADVAAPADAGSAPRLAQGGAAAGRFAVRVTMRGTYAGGSYGTLTGSATLAGSFTTAGGCEARVQSAGTMQGTVTAGAGVVGVTVTFSEVRLDGCGLASPHAFALALPPFAFAPTDDVPQRPGVATARPPIVAPAAPAATGGDALARGQAYLRQARFRDAIQAFDEALQASPGTADALVGRGQAWSALGEAPRALKDFEAILQTRPATPDVRIAMAELWLASGEHERAERALADELRIAPASAMARSYRGTLELVTGRTADARRTMAEAAHLDREIARKRYERGILLLEQRQPRRAATEFASVLACPSPIKAAYFGLGLAMAQLGQPAEAIGMFEHYVAIEPAAPLAARARQELLRLRASGG